MHEPLGPIRRQTSNTSLFSIRGLAYHYPDDTLALSGIDLDIAKGDRIALVGQNGSARPH